GEMQSAIILHDNEEVADGIGDSVVVVTIIANQMGFRVPIGLVDQLQSTENPSSTLLTLIGVLSSAIQKSDEGDALVSLSAIVSVLKRIAHDWSLDFDDCCEHAWNEIKDRKGAMVGGVFVKEAG